MPKSPMDLDTGDGISVINAAGKKFVILNMWNTEYRFNSSLTASQNRQGVDIDDLDSGQDHIYYLATVELLRDILVSLKFRDRDLIGPQGAGKLTQAENGYGDPFMLNLWAYNKKLRADLTENHGIALTDQDLMLFRGVKLQLVEYDPNVHKDVKEFTPVPG